MPPRPPRGRLRPLPRDGRSGRGRPRPGSAGRARIRRSRCRDGASSATASAPRSASSHAAERAAGSGSSLTAPSSRSRISAALGALVRLEQPDVERAGADRRLQLGGRALGDHLAVIDHRDALRQLVGLVEVLRAEEDRRALARQRPDDAPDLVSRARIEAGRGLVEEHQLGRDDDARRQVKPPAHSARVVLDQARRRFDEAERRRGARRPWPLRSRGAGRGGARSGSGSRARSGPRRPRRAVPVRLTTPGRRPPRSTMSWPRTRAVPASGRSSVASIRIVVVLPAPLGPSIP